jgi:hypothetical protein
VPVYGAYRSEPKIKGWTAYTETKKIREGAAGASGTHGSGELNIELT